MFIQTSESGMFLLCFYNNKQGCPADNGYLYYLMRLSVNGGCWKGTRIIGSKSEQCWKIRQTKWGWKGVGQWLGDESWVLCLHDRLYVVFS